MNAAFRLRNAVIAVARGWLGGFVSTVACEVVEVLRNSGGASLPLRDLVFGLLFWMFLTLGIAAAAFCVVMVPVALFFSPGWLQRHERATLAVSIVAALSVPAVNLHIWTTFYHDGIGLTNFWVYAAYFAALAAIAWLSYLQLLRCSSRSSGRGRLEAG